MYTNDEILAMSEDELNHAIARVKGAKWWSIHPIDDAPEDARPVLSGYECMIQDDKGDLPFLELPDGSGVPNWTRDIAAAWGLVEDILSVGGEITLSSETRSDNKRWGIVIFEFRNDGIGTGYTISNFAAAPIISLAISRAWLMWQEGRE